MPFWKRSLRLRLVSYYLFLALATVIAIGFLTYYQARQALEESVYARLETVALLKEDDLKRWVRAQKTDIEFLAHTAPLRPMAVDLLRLDLAGAAESEAYRLAHEALASHLQELEANKPVLQELFILTDIGGQILASSRSQHEGEYQVLARYFTEGKQDTFVQSVYPAPVTGQPTMTISTPLRDHSGQQWGVLAAHLNLDEMDRIVFERTGLGAHGEAYVVDQYNVFVSSERFGRTDFPRGVHTEGIDTAVQGQRGKGSYLNYAGVPVMGHFRWVEDAELALLVEIEQSAAIAPVQRLALITLIIGIALVLFLVLAVSWVGRQVTQPILSIADTAVHISSGDLSREVPVSSSDEVGVLARAFNQMTRQLRILYADMEEKVNELKRAESALRQTRDDLEVRVSERTAELTMLNRVNQSLISTLDLEAILEIILAELYHLLDVTVCTAWLLDTNANELVCRQSAGALRHHMLGKRLPADKGISGWVVQHQQGQVTADVLQDPRADTRFFADLAITPRSAMTVPLIVHGRTIGILQAVDVTIGRFTVSDLALMVSLATPAAFAIENARLFRQAQQDAELRATLLREVNHRVKNNLTAIIGLLYAERRHADLREESVYQDIMEDLISRVQSMATVHNLLSASAWGPISLHELTTQIIRSCLRALPAHQQVTAHVPHTNVRVTPEQASKLAVVINELTTNSIKYAIENRMEGQIDVAIDQQDNLIKFCFCDDGPGYPADVLGTDNPRYNAGFHLIHNFVEHSLEGRLTLQNGMKGKEHGNSGACAIIYFQSQV